MEGVEYKVKAALQVIVNGEEGEAGRGGGVVVERDRDGLVERIERGESEGLVVARLDRFGRSLVDGLSAKTFCRSGVSAATRSA